MAREFAGPDHPTVARAIGTLATLTDNAESVELLQEALRIFRSAFGDDNRDTIQALTNLCAKQTYVDLAAADVTCRDAVAAAERVEGNNAAALAWPLTARGRQLLMAERFEKARENLERGLSLANDGSALLPMEVANLRYYLAAALAETNTDLPRALELAKAAKAEWLTSPREAATAQGADSLINALEAELAKH